jgi:hypothetical protein
MCDEFDALLQNNTWTLIPKPHGANVVSGKWVFRHKYLADGTLARYKARWVYRGFSQQYVVDLAETFSPVVKRSTIRVVLSPGVSSSWHIHQLDVKNAFLHGTLNETVYCQQPYGFKNPSSPDLVCLLHNYLYGSSKLLVLGFINLPLSFKQLVFLLLNLIPLYFIFTLLFTSFIFSFTLMI